MADAFKTAEIKIARVDAVPGATSTFTIDASVQPASGRDLLRLPEGRRSVETRVVFTPTALLAGAQGGNNADLIAIARVDLCSAASVARLARAFGPAAEIDPAQLPPQAQDAIARAADRRARRAGRRAVTR